MAEGNGSAPGSAEKSLGEIVNEISEKATLLVREEIELAKAEVTQKVSRIAKGAALAAIGGVFLVFMLVYFLHWLALFLDDILNVNPSGVWIGYAIVTGGLLVLGLLALFIALRLFKRQGIEFRLGSRVTAARADGKGCVVECEGAPPLQCDRVLLAVGRVANTDDLGLDVVGIALDKKGRIPVNERFATQAEGIFADRLAIGLWPVSSFLSSPSSWP